MNRLRVAVNVRPLVPGKIGGLENQFRGTMTALLRHYGDEVSCTLLTRPVCHESFPDWGDAVERVSAPAPADVGPERFDVLWCPFLFLEPHRPRVPAAVVVPDLQHETYPEFFSKEILAIRLRELRITVSRAHCILTISEFSKRELMRVYGLPEERVVVAPLDATDGFRAPADGERTARLRERLGLPPDYLLLPANAWPHKNHRSLFRALALYRKRYGEPPPLVLTGVAARDGIDLRAEAEAAGVTDLVWHAGFVAADDVPYLYDGARMLVFPSLFEGFGIPVVEAFRRGVPVVASDSTSLPEIAGDCARMVDATDAAALASAIHEVVAHPDLARRLAEAGRRRAERYSYRDTAARTLAALAGIAEQGGGPAALRRPKVAVVTPCLQGARFLRDTIDSVLAQDYPDLEYTVRDGGSTDGTVEILCEYGDRIDWRSTSDGGQAAAIGQAWRETDADVVAWLNADDTYLPGAVSEAVTYLEEHPEVAMVYGNAWYTDADGNRTEPYPTKHPFDRDALAGECYVCQPATFVRREVFRVVDLPDADLRYAMDYDLWIRLSAWFGVGFLDRFLATSRMHAANKTLSERDGVYREAQRVSRRHFGRVHRSWIRGYRDHRLRRLVRRLLWFVPDDVLASARARLVARMAQRLPAPPFADGWCGRRTLLQIDDPSADWVEIEADSPVLPRRGRYRVTVRCNEHAVAQHTVRRRGPFTLRFRLAHNRLARPLLVLESSRVFVEGTRSLAFRIRRVAVGGAGADGGVGA